MKSLNALMAATAVALLLAAPVAAKEALCYTSDDGEYDCWFESLDSAGSFEISAPGKPTFSLWVESPGIATAGAVFEAGGRSVPLPGTYIRSEDDGACWDNSETGTQICAW